MIQSIVLPRLIDRAHLVSKIAVALYALPADQAYRVELHEHKSTRSNQQNAYLNGICYKLIGDSIGYERDEVSEFLCGTYFGWKDKRVPKKPSNPLGIESVPIRTTTTDEHGARSVLNKLEMGEYIAFVQRFAASKGIHIPDPDESAFMDDAA